MNYKKLYQLASLVMALVMIMGNTISTQAATPIAQATGPSIYWGAMVDGSAPSTTNLQGTFNTFETRSKKKMSIIHWGQSWIGRDGTWGEFQTTYYTNVRNHGSIPMINWTSQKLGAGTNQADFQNRDIYGGKYDTYIRRWATAAKSWGHPFFLRFNHEGNGWWYPWGEGKTSTGVVVNGNSAGDYVKAWRHVHDIFVSVGATNVTWVWSPNQLGSTTRYPSLASIYPGDGYVDWTGLTIYNKYSTWLGFNPLMSANGVTWLKNSYQAVLNVAPGKPMMLAEVASFEAGDGGTKKAAWIKDMLTTQLPTNFPKVKAIVWMNWDVNVGKTYPIESSQAATDAWAAGIGAAKFASNQYANLNTSPIPAPGGTTAAATLAPNYTFSDVPDTYWAWDFIEKLYSAGVTGGCGTNPLIYCPEDVVSRAQMAVFLARGMRGSSYAPPAVDNGTGFNDVPSDYWAAAWIKELAADGITGGCGDGNYCPDLPVTRDQMAVFLLRSEHGSSYSPPAVVGSTGFDDVPSDYWAAAWIQQLVAEGITSGCGNGSYCPDAPVTRAQMAVFLVRAFNVK